MAVTSAGHTVLVIDEAPQISEPGHGCLQPRPENNAGWFQFLFFVCFTAFQGDHPVPVQQPMELVPPDHAVSDLEAQISEQGHGPLGFLLLMFRSLASFALGQNQSDPFWRLILLTTVNLVVAAMIGLVCLPKAFQEVHDTSHRVILTIIVVVPIVVAMMTFLASIWIRRNDGQGRSNWITALSVVNVTMLAGPLLLYWRM